VSKLLSVSLSLVNQFDNQCVDVNAVLALAGMKMTSLLQRRVQSYYKVL